MKKKSKLMAAVFALILGVSTVMPNAGTGIGYESFSSYLSSGSWE